MQTADALNIIQALSHGANPRTGEAYPENSPFQNAEIVRALMLAARGLENLVRAEKRQHGLPPNVGKPWSVEDEIQLGTAFDAGRSIRDIAKDLQRTQGAIRARLVKIGKMEDDGSFYRPRSILSAI